MTGEEPLRLSSGVEEARGARRSASSCESTGPSDGGRRRREGGSMQYVTLQNQWMGIHTQQGQIHVILTISNRVVS